ncbi:PREDICTED: major royal jelly protein 3-like isoform X2 [Trachymyrmex cornetzi]|uniref:major royal jelly protein 3-like isoform X2 n=1 Tax=Trachymyrmex cornetzi TaxID=471704 RepID=UPI00084F4950|nr:PREDICTED: major royal jelly protein 3-like isoform X2 [Trachymyrmex cornetzi]
MMKIGHPLFTLLILSMVIVSFGDKVKNIYTWKFPEFEWLSKEQEEDAISSGIYNSSRCVFEDADEAEDGRIFITVSNINTHASPATLTTVTNKTGLGGPILRPYPDWSWYNSSYMCDGIINVYRIDIRCNHLFVMDIGKIGTDRICNPKLLIFNLKDDTLVKIIYIPIDTATDKTDSGLLVMPLVYIPNGKCTQFLDDMIVFITDTGDSSLVVYNSFTKSMCTVESDYMKPTDTFFSVAGENFTYVGGIFSITVLDDDLYFAAVSGKEIYKIQIKNLLECPNKEKANEQTQLVKKLSSQTVVLTSAGQSIFYSDFQAMSILRMTKSDNYETMLAQDSENFQSISSMKISSNGCQLKCISDRFQLYALNKLNTNETNVRYFKINLC